MRGGVPGARAARRRARGPCSCSAFAPLELGDLPGARAALAGGVPAIVDIGDRFVHSGRADRPRRAGRPGGAHEGRFRLVGAAAAYEEVNQSALPEPIRAELDTWLAPSRRAAGAAAHRLIDEGRADAR